MIRKKKTKNKKDQKASLKSHLVELRKRIVTMVVTFLIVIIPAFEFAPYIVEYFCDIAVSYGYKIVYLSPTELFTQYIKVTLVIGISILIPLMIYHIWAFCKPGLKKKENRYFIGAVSFGFLSFVAGIVFSYYTILPFMLQFFISVNTSSNIAASISVANYIGFILSTLLIFGCIFEMPVIISTLSLLRIVKAELLKKGRKVVIVGIFFICAIITPPDVVSQIMVAIPMIMLYEVSIFISSLIEKQRNKKNS